MYLQTMFLSKTLHPRDVCENQLGKSSDEEEKELKQDVYIVWTATINLLRSY